MEFIANKFFVFRGPIDKSILYDQEHYQTKTDRLKLMTFIIRKIQ